MINTVKRVGPVQSHYDIVRFGTSLSKILISLGGYDARFSPLRPGFESRMGNSFYLFSGFVIADRGSFLQ